MADRERERERERSESCNSRHISRIIKSCFPNPNNQTSPSLTTIPKPHHTPTITTISSLPDDLLLHILSLLPLSSLPSLSSVCRRWLLLLHHPFFLLLRHHHRLLHPTLFSFSPSSSSASLRPLIDTSWSPLSLPFNDTLSLPDSRFIPLGRKIYIISRSASAFFDPWTASLRPRSTPLFPRKRFAAAQLSGRIYIAGGSATVTAVEEYDPDTDTWRVVSHAPRKRYGCIGVGIEGVFYIVGGLRVGGACGSRAISYASSMDLYDVVGGGWLRSRGVPGGGCVVAACGAHGHVYVLASHAVELSFWRFNAKRSGGGGGFGEWCRVRGPPLPAQVRVDGTVRFSCVGMQDKVVLIQVMGSIDDLLRRSGRNVRGCKDGLVLIFDCVTEEWSRGPDLPHLLHRSACVCVEC